MTSGQLHPSSSCSFSIAARVAITRVVSITSRAVKRLLATRRTPVRLRAARAKPSSGATSMTSVLPLAPSRRSSSAAAFVFASPLERVDDDERTRPAASERERRSQRAAAHFARQGIVVAARLRPEDGAALPPQRIPDLADPRAAGALLAPGLLAAAADQRPVLRHVRAAALRRLLVHDRFPDQIGLDAAAEHLVATARASRRSRSAR